MQIYFMLTKTKSARQGLIIYNMCWHNIVADNMESCDTFHRQRFGVINTQIWNVLRTYQGPLLLTLFNFNPIVDK